MFLNIGSYRANNLPRPEESSFPATQNGKSRYGILLLHEGAPEHLSYYSVARFLSRRLSSERVVDNVPWWQWMPFLYGVVLPWKTVQMKRLYASTWVTTPTATADTVAASTAISSAGGDGDSAPIAPAVTPPWGQAMSVYNLRQLALMVQHILPALHAFLQDVDHAASDIAVQVEMASYQETESIKAALERMKLMGNYAGVVDGRGVPVSVEDEHLIVLPLYPQYCSSTSGAAFDALVSCEYFKKHRAVPNLHYIRSYHQHPAYIQALADEVRDYFAEHGSPDWLCIVYEGIPQRFVKDGDCYQSECVRTFQLLREALSTPTSTSRSVTPLSVIPTPRLEDEGGNTSVDASAFSENGNNSSCLRSTYTAPFPAHKLTMSFTRDTHDSPSLEPTLQQLVARVSGQVSQSRGNTPRPSREQSVSRAALGTHDSKDTPLAVNHSPPGGLGKVYIFCPSAVVDHVGSLAASEDSIRELFGKHGWEHVSFIPALGESLRHAHMISKIVSDLIR